MCTSPLRWARNCSSPHFFAVLFLFAFFIAGINALEAQPGGGFGGPGGGRPPMGRRPGGDPSKMRRGDNPPDDKKGSSVKQKKIGTTYKVVGTLRDSVNGEFVPFVNVSVLTSTDSTFVKGAASNFDGYFEVSDIPAGDYVLRVSAIGYRNFYKAFSVENNTALGTLNLKPGATTLQEVKITAEKPLYAMDGEKMIYNVEDDPSIQTGTTNDALQNAPGVEVDIEGNVSLRGTSNVEIWINDKPSKLTEENLKTYLETLPANALARIETITNPSAKYATEADAVINIITSAHIKSNQFISFGINGSSQPFVSPWISYMWAKEKLSFNIYASGRYSFNENHGASRAFSRRDNLSAPGTYDTVQFDSTYSYSNNKNLSGNIFFQLAYEIDSSSDIELHASTNISRPWSENNSMHVRDQSFIGAPRYTYYDTTDNPGDNSWFGMAGIDYTKKFNNEGHNLMASVYSHFSGGKDDLYDSRTYDNAIYSDLDYNKYIHTDRRSLGLGMNARYNRPYSKDGELSYGFSFYHNDSHDSYDRIHYDPATDSYARNDSLRSYSHDNNNNRINADVNWTRRWGGFTLELGFGLGYDNLHFDYDNTLFHDDTTYNRLTYNPSIHLSYRTESLHNFKLNYSLHTHTPDGSQLTSFPTYSEDSYRIGNRNLTNYYSHNAEMGWTKYFERFGNVGLEGYFRYSNDEIDNLTDQTDSDPYILNRIVNFSTPYNMGASWRYGASANITYRPTGFFNLRFYANAYESGYTIDYRGQERSDHMFSYSLRLNGWAKIFEKYQIHASINYSSPTQGLFSSQKARYNFNLGLRADFLKRKISAFINIQDLFNWGGRFGSGSENTNPYYLSESTNKRLNSRFISAGITFRFGKMELESNAKAGADESGE